MDPISYRSGTNARMGGVDITISLTPAQEKALGPESGTLADWLHTALWALALLRTGQNAAGEPYVAGPSDWYTAINDLDHRLLPRLEGLRDAVVREHARSGGSIGDLALAMDVKRSTAQYRRDAIINGKDRPSNWERWATDGGPENNQRTKTPERTEFCNACGEPASPLNPLVTTADEDRFRIHRSHTLDSNDGFYAVSVISE